MIVVFFDGVCGLCNQSVDYLIRNDSKRLFKYSPLQGEEIKKYETSLNAECKRDTLLVWDGMRLRAKTDAWVFLLAQLGGTNLFLSKIFCVFPYSLMDILYDFIARHRYKVFGKWKSCRIPSPNEASLFLD